MTYLRPIFSLLAVCLALLSQPALAQEKTHAFFIVGNYTSPDWETLSFDKSGSGWVLTYAYKQREDGIRLHPIGLKSANGQRVLLVRIPGTNQPYIIRRDRAGERLIMTSRDGRYDKTFKLGYEGPVDGVGTYCARCANEPADAFALVNAYFSSIR